MDTQGQSISGASGSSSTKWLQESPHFLWLVILMPNVKKYSMMMFAFPNRLISMNFCNNLKKFEETSKLVAYKGSYEKNATLCRINLKGATKRCVYQDLNIEYL